VLLTCQADAFDEAGWPTQFAWLRQTLETFDLVFRPLVARQAH
jgi:hypothetical protein